LWIVFPIRDDELTAVRTFKPRLKSPLSSAYRLPLCVVVFCMLFAPLLPISAIADGYDATNVKTHLSDVVSRYHDLPLMVTSEWTSFESGDEAPMAWRREAFACDSNGRKRITFESGTFSRDQTRVINPRLFRHMWYNGVDTLTSHYQSEILTNTLHKGIYPPPRGVTMSWNPLTFMRLALLEIIKNSLNDQRTVSVVEQGEELFLVTQASNDPNALTYSAQIRPDHDWAVTVLRASKSDETMFERLTSYEQFGGGVWAPRSSRWHNTRSAERFDLISLVLDKAELPDLSEIRLEPHALLADFRPGSKGEFVLGATGSISDRLPFGRPESLITISPNSGGRRWFFVLANCTVVLFLIVLIVRRWFGPSS
jgi:hypothetical protein